MQKEGHSGKTLFVLNEMTLKRETKGKFNFYKRKCKMVKDILTRRKDSDTFLATVSRQYWSRQMTMKIDRM
jgi:hypothetical protein